MVRFARLALSMFLLVGLVAVVPVEGRDAPPDLDTPAGIKKALGDSDGSVQLAAARAALTVQDRTLTAPLLKLLKSDRLPLREAALDALVARESEKDKKAAAKGIAARLKPLVREPGTLDRARELFLVPALHDLAQEVSIKALLDLHTEAPPELKKPRLLAVANVPSKKAIDALIAFGSKQRRGRGRQSGFQEAMHYATGLKLGGDPDKWREWWRDAEDEFDVEAAARARQEERDSGAARRERKEDAQRTKEERRREREERKKGRKKPDDGDEGEAPADGE